MVSPFSLEVRVVGRGLAGGPGPVWGYASTVTSRSARISVTWSRSMAGTWLKVFLPLTMRVAYTTANCAASYYSMAENASVLNNFAFIMKGSFLKTLAANGNASCKKIRKKYEQDGVISIPYVTKSGPKRCEFYHDGFTKKSTLPALSAGTLPQYVKYDKPNSLAKRLKAGICELCGAETKEIHMHHVRRLKDLTGKNDLELKMMQMRRKSIALCPECYAKTKYAE